LISPFHLRRAEHVEKIGDIKGAERCLRGSDSRTIPVARRQLGGRHELLRAPQRQYQLALLLFPPHSARWVDSTFPQPERVVGFFWLNGGAGNGAETLSLVRREFPEVPDNYPKCRSGEDYLSGVKYWLGVDNPNRRTLPDNLKEFESRLDELRSKLDYLQGITQ
jgi:hypothetical protein